MKQHDLKIYPSYFEAVTSGVKTAEVRRDDRGYSVGDEVVLREFDPLLNRLTGRYVVCTITYILKNIPGIEDGYCIFYFKRK